MYNRKFDIRRDFSELTKLEHEIMPIIREIESEEEREKVSNYLRETFFNQWKK